MYFYILTLSKFFTSIFWHFQNIVRFIRRGYHWGDITPMRPESNHIRHWHHSQPKTLRQWVYGSLFLYSALLSHTWILNNLPLKGESLQPHWYTSLQRKLPNHEYSFSALFYTAVILNGTRFIWPALLGILSILGPYWYCTRLSRY